MDRPLPESLKNARLVSERIHLDRTDAKILTELQRDATIAIATLADRVGLSASPCWKRVQKLEKSGVITGRVALVDAARVGLGWRCWSRSRRWTTPPNGAPASSLPSKPCQK